MCEIIVALWMREDSLQEWDGILTPFFYGKPIHKSKILFMIMKYMLIKYVSYTAVLLWHLPWKLCSIYSLKHGLQGFSVVAAEKSPHPDVNKKKVELQSLYCFLTEEDIDLVKNRLNSEIKI